jgi:hypothetical protein
VDDDSPLKLFDRGESEGKVFLVDDIERQCSSPMSQIHRREDRVCIQAMIQAAGLSLYSGPHADLFRSGLPTLKIRGVDALIYQHPSIIAALFKFEAQKVFGSNVFVMLTTQKMQTAVISSAFHDECLGDDSASAVQYFKDQPEVRAVLVLNVDASVAALLCLRGEQPDMPATEEKKSAPTLIHLFTTDGANLHVRGVTRTTHLPCSRVMLDGSSSLEGSSISRCALLGLLCLYLSHPWKRVRDIVRIAAQELPLLHEHHTTPDSSRQQSSSSSWPPNNRRSVCTSASKMETLLLLTSIPSLMVFNALYNAKRRTVVCRALKISECKNSRLELFGFLSTEPIGSLLARHLEKVKFNGIKGLQIRTTGNRKLQRTVCLRTPTGCIYIPGLRQGSLVDVLTDTRRIALFLDQTNCMKGLVDNEDHELLKRYFPTDSFLRQHPYDKFVYVNKNPVHLPSLHVQCTLNIGQKIREILDPLVWKDATNIITSYLIECPKTNRKSIESAASLVMHQTLSEFPEETPLISMDIGNDPESFYAAFPDNCPAKLEIFSSCRIINRKQTFTTTRDVFGMMYDHHFDQDGANASLRDLLGNFRERSTVTVSVSFDPCRHRTFAFKGTVSVDCLRVHCSTYAGVLCQALRAMAVEAGAFQPSAALSGVAINLEQYIGNTAHSNSCLFDVIRGPMTFEGCVDPLSLVSKNCLARARLFVAVQECELPQFYVPGDDSVLAALRCSVASSRLNEVYFRGMRGYHPHPSQHSLEFGGNLILNVVTDDIADVDFVLQGLSQGISDRTVWREERMAGPDSAVKISIPLHGSTFATKAIPMHLQYLEYILPMHIKDARRAFIAWNRTGGYCRLLEVGDEMQYSHHDEGCFRLQGFTATMASKVDMGVSSNFPVASLVQLLGKDLSVTLDFRDSRFHMWNSDDPCLSTFPETNRVSRVIKAVSFEAACKCAAEIFGECATDALRGYRLSLITNDNGNKRPESTLIVPAMWVNPNYHPTRVYAEAGLSADDMKSVFDDSNIKDPTSGFRHVLAIGNASPILELAQGLPRCLGSLSSTPHSSGDKSKALMHAFDISNFPSVDPASMALAVVINMLACGCLACQAVIDLRTIELVYNPTRFEKVVCLDIPKFEAIIRVSNQKFHASTRLVRTSQSRTESRLIQDLGLGGLDILGTNIVADVPGQKFTSCLAYASEIICHDLFLSSDDEVCFDLDGVQRKPVFILGKDCFFYRSDITLEHFDAEALLKAKGCIKRKREL